MRIVYLHQYFVTPDMPGGTRSYEMARRLVQAGHEVELITADRSTGGGTGWRQTVEDGIRVHWVPVHYSTHMSYPQRMRSFCSFAWLAGVRAAQLRADVVFATSTPLTIALPGVYAARRLNVPMVFEVRDLWPEVPIAVGAIKGRAAIYAAERLERYAYDNARHVVALSPGMRDGVLSKGVPAKRVSLIPNSCDMQRFDVGPAAGSAVRNRLPWLGKRPLVLYAGSVSLVNRVDYLAETAAAIRAINPEIRFLVIGSGNREQQLRRRAQEVGVLNHNFFMMGQGSKSEIPAYFAAADIAATTMLPLPETWKNSANKFFDTLASGTPAAINYQGWQADLIRETGVGLVLDTHSVSRAAVQLATVLNDRAWLERAGEAARRVAAERFDRDLLAQQLERVLLQSVAQPLAGAA